MKKLVIGNTTLEYSVRVSYKTKQKRIEITPDRIEVIVPGGTSPKAIIDFQFLDLINGFKLNNK